MQTFKLVAMFFCILLMVNAQTTGDDGSNTGGSGTDVTTQQEDDGTNTIMINEEGGNSLELIYNTANNDVNYNIEFKLNLAQALQAGEVATAVCAHTDSSSFNMQSGASAEAFGVEFYCPVSDNPAFSCMNPLDVAVSLFGSNVEFDGTNYKWKYHSADVSNTNKGNMPGAGNKIETFFHMTNDQAKAVHIPQFGETVYLKCFTGYALDHSTSMLTKEPTLTSWNQDTHEADITFEFIDNGSGNGSDSSSAFSMAFAPITLIASFIIFGFVF